MAGLQLVGGLNSASLVHGRVGPDSARGQVSGSFGAQRPPQCLAAASTSPRFTMRQCQRSESPSAKAHSEAGFIKTQPERCSRPRVWPNLCAMIIATFTGLRSRTLVIKSQVRLPRETVKPVLAPANAPSPTPHPVPESRTTPRGSP
jgi:hypothetical protein